MKTFKLLASFLFLLIISLLISFGNLDAGPSLRYLPRGFALDFDWFGSADRLDKLDLTQRILAHISESYVEPDRVNYEEMFKKGMNEVAQNVAEVRMIYPEPRRATLVVNDQRVEFNTDFKNPYALQAAFS